MEVMEVKADTGDSNVVTIEEWHRQNPDAEGRDRPWWLASDRRGGDVEVLFGQISNGGANAEPATWHALKPQGDGFTTMCTAMSARPNLKVIATAPEPGPVMCRLARCRNVIEQWRSSSQM
jgi:hypothetical protein